MSIPKKIHLIWVGGNKPEWTEYIVNEIKRINFDYEVIEWNDSNIDFELKNQSLYDQCENLGAKSDILRFEILHKYGGIYLDYDNLVVKKFDDLLHYDFFSGTDARNPNDVFIGVIGSKPNNEICEKYLEDISNVIPLKKDDVYRVIDETGPNRLKRTINNNVWTCNFKIFVGPTFYPFDAVSRINHTNYSEEYFNSLRSCSTEETYTIHFHSCTWQ
jgi:mannosyltransferase OCH1-like enzyme